MKLALGMMVHNDAHWLKLHLPVYMCQFDGLVFVEDPSNDDETRAELIRLNIQTGKVYVYEHPWNNNWSEMFNHVLDHAEQLGFDAIIRMDPDEAIFETDVKAIRGLLEVYSILCFPRYNFWQDRLHYTPGIFPDWQARAWRLNKGIRLGGQHHEGIGWLQYNMFEGDPIGDSPRQVLRVPHLPIYHYGNVGKERILERDLHYLNVAREAEGHPPLAERPLERAFPTRHKIPFTTPQPIDPDSNPYAPFDK